MFSVIFNKKEYITIMNWRILSSNHEKIITRCFLQTNRKFGLMNSRNSPLTQSPKMLTFKLLKENQLQIFFTMNRVGTFHLDWLRDHEEKVSFHPITNQRLIDVTSLNNGKDVKEIRITDNNSILSIDWLDGKTSTFSCNYLSSNPAGKMETRDFRFGLKEPILWDCLNKLPHFESLNLIPTVSYKKQNEPDKQKKMLEALCTHGVVLIRDMPSGVRETESFINENFGPARHTALYGGMWDTAPREESKMNDTAYTQLALDGHTDCCYLVDSPGLQCFNCVAQSTLKEEEGVTKLLDGFRLIQHMMMNNNEAYHFFRTHPLVFQHVEEKSIVRNVAKVIEIDEISQRVKQFRFNAYDLGPLDYFYNDLDLIDAYYRHVKYLVRLIQSETFQTKYKLNVGEMLVLDNRRVLHGRTSFTGYRNLIGCYVGYDDWTGFARAKFEKERVILENEYKHLWNL